MKPIARIDKTRSDLSEIKRYVRRLPPEEIVEKIEKICLEISYLPTVRSSRLMSNLQTGAGWTLVAPNILEAYIEATLFELLDHRCKLAKEAGSG